jgi:flagellar basal-body rod protein FlgG
MLRALYSSAAGMQAQQLNLDVIANNLANVNTAGFKKMKPEFEELLYQTNRTAGSEQGAGNQLPSGLQIGHGSQLVATTRVFTPGEISQTGGELDIAIVGDGFWQVTLPDGRNAFTRDGSLKRSSDGRVVNNSGMPLQGGWQPVPADATIEISQDGMVSLTSGSGAKQSFQVQLVRFANPAGLKSIGHNLYTETDASGTPETGSPGNNGFGELRQRSVELSNVKVVEEMVNLIVAQRAYEVNSKAVQAADEMMQQSNNLRR